MSQTKTEVDHGMFTEFLKERGVNVENLAIVLLGGSEQILGELEGGGLPLDFQTVLSGGAGGGPGFVVINNPKRILRLQSSAAGGFGIHILLSHYDLMDSGKISVRPGGGFFLREQGLATQVEYLALYADFLRKMDQNRAVEAGLVLPQSNLLLGRK